MSRKYLNWISWFPIVLFFPYLLIIMLQDVDISLKNHKPDVENYLAFFVSEQIDKRYDKEAIKAQVVIARTNLIRKIKKDSFYEVFCELAEMEKKKMKTFNWFWKKENEIFQEAVSETENQVLIYEGKLPLVPYHEVSGGRTRDGAECFHNQKYEYLISVDSSMDRTCPEFSKEIYYSKKIIPSEIEVLEKDSAGYVLVLKTENNLMEGEAFRKSIFLPSCNFTIKENEREYSFICKGKGHGIGYSQYGGDVLAERGSDYIKILNYYFPRLKVEKLKDNLPIDE